MNIYAIIILFTLLAEYILGFIADVLNLRTLDTPLPKEFEEVYDAEAYRKSQEYTKVRTRFGILSGSISLLLTVIFWFAGGFNAIDQIVRSWNLGSVWTGPAYIGILMVLRSVVSLPFRIYSTFVIEERFGFNKTTPKTFVVDIFKGLLLAVLIGGPLLVGVLALFEYAGPLAWVYAWIGATVVTLFLQFIAPTWIMPLFNKFTPLEDGDLRKEIFAYASNVRFSLQNIYVMDGSKRSSKSNAFFTGFGSNKRIALFDTLIQKHTVAELVAVLAHEIGHYKKRHVIKGMVMSIAHMGVMLFLLSIFVSEKGLFDAFYMEQQSIYAGLVFFGLLFTPIEFLLSLFLHSISRKHEFEADRFAAETYDSHPMIDALKKLSVHNLSHLSPHPFYVALNYSHPPVVERIGALKSIVPPRAL